MKIIIAFTLILLSLVKSNGKKNNLEETKLSYDPLAIHWNSLSFDNDHFLCANYESLCTNFLDEIGCSSTNRTNIGCPKGNILDFQGFCICLGNPVYEDRSGRIAEQLVDNRIKGEIGWMLEPWASGPPYSLDTSYLGICRLTLYRLGCAQDQMQIGLANTDGTIPFQCQCGNFTTASGRIEELICDKINEAALAELPVFSDPVTLSVELSLAVVLIIGKLGAILATFLYLPPIIGFLLAGLGIQDIISQGLIKGIGGNGPHSTPFGEIRIFALVIVIMRAGISIKPKDILKGGYLAIALSVLPYFAEFAAILGIGMTVLKWPVVEMGLLASILAALSPSLVIPGMIKFVEQKLGYTPSAVLTSAPIEVVLAIILFNIFSNLVQANGNPLYPWVKVLPLSANIVLIPLNILFSSVLGFFTGYSILKYIEYRKTTDNKIMKRIVGDSTAEFLFIVIVACYTLYALCQVQYIQQSSGILAIFAMTLTMAELGSPDIIVPLKEALAGLWVFVEVFLFTTTGINLGFRSTTGPLQSQRGINQQAVSQLVEILLIGTMGRSAAILVVQIIGYFTLAPHRRDIRYMLAWWIATWMFQWPKATVQATLGGLPFSQHLIPGAIGLTRGLFIQQASAFAVLLMAPIGIFLTAVIGHPLALYLNKKDEEHGYLPVGIVIKDPKDIKPDDYSLRDINTVDIEMESMEKQKIGIETESIKEQTI